MASCGSHSGYGHYPGLLESSVPPVLPGSPQVALNGFGVDGAWACLLGDKQDIVRANSDTGPTKHPVEFLGEEGSSLCGHWGKCYPRADWVRTGSQEGADSRNRTEEGRLSTETEGRKEGKVQLAGAGGAGDEMEKGHTGLKCGFN